MGNIIVVQDIQRSNCFVYSILQILMAGNYAFPPQISERTIIENDYTTNGISFIETGCRARSRGDHEERFNQRYLESAILAIHFCDHVCIPGELVVQSINRSDSQSTNQSIDR